MITTFHDQAYEYCSWEDCGQDVFTLAKKIIKSGEKFDRMIALAKGGLSLSRALGDYLQIPQLSSLQIEFYTGIGETAKTPVITQSLPISVKGEKILIFDDICDTGETLKLAVQYVGYHGAKSIKTASQINKSWSRFKVDFTARETTAWFIFPHETRETIELLTSIWAKKGDSPEEIKKQLLQIGLPKAAVEMFSQVK